jgi:hypoxanthine phosphoribosyltransferase
MALNKVVMKIYATDADIYSQLSALSEKINRDYSGVELDLVYVSTGAFVFANDLAQMIRIPFRMHPISYSDYHPPSGNGEIQLLLDVSTPLMNRHVLLLDGIVISGKTPCFVMGLLRLRMPASLELCVVGFKPKKLSVDINIKYHLFSLENEWIEGYGIGSGGNKFSRSLVDVS